MLSRIKHFPICKALHLPVRGERLGQARGTAVDVVMMEGDEPSRQRRSGDRTVDDKEAVHIRALLVLLSKHVRNADVRLDRKNRRERRRGRRKNRGEIRSDVDVQLADVPRKREGNGMGEKRREKEKKKEERHDVGRWGAREKRGGLKREERVELERRRPFGKCGHRERVERASQKGWDLQIADIVSEQYREHDHFSAHGFMFWKWVGLRSKVVNLAPFFAAQNCRLLFPASLYCRALELNDLESSRIIQMLVSYKLK